MGKITLKDSISRGIKVHGDRYDYSLVEYIDSTTKVDIICRIHGVFSQIPSNHWRGAGCPKCKGDKIRKIRKKTTKSFIRDAVAKHGTRYDYSDTVYHGVSQKVDIICRIHGVFSQGAGNHIQGSGCPECGRVQVHEILRSDTETFVHKAKSVHGDRYDYDKTSYTLSSGKVLITCRTHGDFNQVANAHINGAGCPECGTITTASKLALTHDQFIHRAKSKHTDKYDYTDTVFTTLNSGVSIRCNIHGMFHQNASRHLMGSGCPACAVDSARLGLRIGVDEIKRRLIDVHGDKYDYSNFTSYASIKDKMHVVCNKHGDFTQEISSHLKGSGCPKCWRYGGSVGEKDLGDFIESLDIDVVRNSRSMMPDLCNGKHEIDILCPEQKIAVEYNGNIWHSSKFIGIKQARKIHINKFNHMANIGYRLVFVRSDEWLEKRHIVESIITNALGQTTGRIMARKCTISVVPLKQWQAFVNNNHIQGACGCKYKLGLYFNGELVSTIGVAANGNMVRYATKLGYVVIGGLSRLIKALGVPLFTYCERRLFSGRGYEAAGFVRGCISPPDLSYVKKDLWSNRRMFQKSIQAKTFPDFDPHLTEAVNAANHGWHQLYGCGHIKYTWVPK